MSRDELVAAGREVSVPFAIALADDAPLSFVQLFRVLPARRVVGKAKWRGQTVLAKLYLSQSAAKECTRELEGLRRLTEAHVPTPQLRGHARTADGMHVLLTEYLDRARTLGDHVAERPRASTSRQLPQCIVDVLPLLGRLHEAGLAHADLHPGNFLEQDGTWSLIDGDAVSALPRNDPATSAKENLALFLAQFPPETVPSPADALPAYLSARRGQDLAADELEALIEAARGKRLRRLLAKTGRDCTQFKVTQTSDRFVSVLRASDSWLAAVVANPAKSLEAGKRLKSGRTATVARVSVAAHEIVIKQYNIKSMAHGLSRAVRPSRAWHAWVEAHRLDFLGIHTAAPLAVVERRFGPFRREAWLITDFVEGVNLRDLFSGREGQTPRVAEAQALKQAFDALHRNRIIHGDLKATNLVFSDARLVLLDLDACAQYHNDRSYLKAWRRDRERFLRNWPADSVLARFLDNLLPHADTLSPRRGPQPRNV